jgi:CHAD domain-containing protein
MHKKELSHIVDKRFGAFCENWKGMHDLQVDAIHDWRVDYKKLRAILRMASEEDEKIHIPLSLKDVYSLTGEIRDRQMQLERMKEWFGNEIFFPPTYSEFIKQEIGEYGDQLHPLTENDAVLQISQHKVKLALPSRVTNKTIHAFLQEQLYEIRNILWLTYKKDDYLHSCRKHLKDLQYVIDGVGKEEIETEKLNGLPSFEQLQSGAQELGNFNDQCVTMRYMSSSYLNRLPAEEKLILSSYKNKLQREKTRNKNKLISSLEVLFAKIL